MASSDNRNSLLSYIVDEFTDQTELVSTKALAYILGRSPAARDALRELLRIGNADVGPIASVEAESEGDDTAASTSPSATTPARSAFSSRRSSGPASPATSPPLTSNGSPTTASRPFSSSSRRRCGWARSGRSSAHGQKMRASR